MERAQEVQRLCSQMQSRIDELKFTAGSVVESLDGTRDLLTRNSAAQMFIRGASLRYKQAAKAREIKSRRARGAVGRWQMKAWSGTQLLEEFKIMDVDNSNGVDKYELASFLQPLKFGEWTDEEMDELFDFLDVDGDGVISVHDFASAVVAPMQKEQVERAIDAKAIGHIIADALPVPSVGEDGCLPNALEHAVRLSPAEIEQLVIRSAKAIAEVVHEQLQPHGEMQQAKQAEGPPATAKFTFEFADVGEAEQGALCERLGLPSADVVQGMAREHESEAEWTTGNYGLTTSPKQEFEFVDAPADGKVYPGEGEGGRRRQDAGEAWRRTHSELPVEEALRGFASRLGALDAEVLVRTVTGQLGRHPSEAEKAEREERELRRALVQALLPQKEFLDDDLDALVEALDGGVLEAAAGGRWMSAGEKREWVQRQLQREVRVLRERLAAWDASLAECKAVMLYTGPMFEKYNGVLRGLGKGGDDVPYKTTILMLISAVMKLRRRTTLAGDRKVFRGLKGGELPASWMFEGLLGSKGGAEKAFMSTSTRWEEAAKYATRGGNPVVIEIALGQIDKGADVSSLSQYPGEAEVLAVVLLSLSADPSSCLHECATLQPEPLTALAQVLFPPMTNLEVVGLPRLESFGGQPLMVLSIRANVSLRNETREELAAKRKHVFMPSLTNVLLEVQRDIDALAMLPPVSPALERHKFWMRNVVMGDCRGVVAQYETRPPGWFQSDQHYQVSVQEAAGLRRLAVAKFRRLWHASLPENEEEMLAQTREWEGRLLSAVDSDELNQRTRRWEASKAEANKERERMPEAREESAREARREERARRLREDAVALCEWMGLLDASDKDVRVDVAGNTTLILAAVRGESRKVELLLDAGCDPAACNARGDTPLHRAAAEGHAEAVAALLDGGADADVRDGEGHSGLTIACKRGFVAVALALVEKGADVEAKDPTGCTPLIYACAKGMEGVALRLLERVVAANARDISGRSALTFACQQGMHEVAMRLVAAGAEVNVADIQGRTPLICACEKRMEQLALKLVACGASVNVQDQQGWTPLLMACQKGLAAAAERLVHAAADVSARDADGCTPLMWARESRMDGVSALLVERGATLNAKDIYLEKVEAVWQAQELSVRPYQSEDFVLVGVEEVFSVLQDHCDGLATILATRFVVGVRERVGWWRTRLEHLSSTLEEWLEVQRSWMYLGQVLTGVELQKVLPEEAARFKEVDRDWKALMQQTRAAPNAVQACGRDVLQRLHAARESLGSCERRLQDFLGGKRWEFPRLSFLSNDEVLELLNRGRDPRQVQEFFSKIFQGVHRVEVEEGGDACGGLQIVAIKAAQNMESVHLLPSVQLDELNVEEWLCLLESAMRETLQQRTAAAAVAFSQQPRDEWLFSFPSASVQVVLLIEWTRRVSTALEGAEKGGEAALEEALAADQAEVQGLVGMVRQDLPKRQCRVVNTLFQAVVHARDVSQWMISNKVHSRESFAWQSQLRFYWDVDVQKQQACTVRQSHATLFYGWEYVGVPGRLVITPLTDKIWATMTAALQLMLGCAPAGPAGTGKTETVKDLGSALGRQCVVFNCSDGLDYKMMEKFFSGLVQTGAWSCFDEFNRINLEVLSSLAQQMSTIFAALRRGAAKFNFCGTELRVKDGFGCFVTMNPGYAGRTELPDNLKALFRPVAVVVADYALIAEIQLFAEGFADAKRLSRKLTHCYKLSSEQLSQQSHYDFGMRAIKTALATAGALRRASPEQSEDSTLLRTLRDTNLSRFVSSDVPIFNAILSDLFPGVMAPATDLLVLASCVERALHEDGKEAVPEMVAKSLQLHQTVLVRHGIMLVGPAPVGKTACRTALGTAMSRLSAEGVGGFQSVRSSAIVNPKAVSLEKLFGHFTLSGEWEDGILPVLFREAAHRSDGGSAREWICLDGLVDALWAENMNTVLDDSKVLLLMSGERIPLTPSMTVVIETSDLSVASPATVSRCGMVFFDRNVMCWRPSVRTWARGHGGSGERVMRMMELLCDKTLAFLSSECKQHFSTEDTSLVDSCCALVGSLLRPEPAETGELADRVAEGVLERVFAFCFAWAFGGSLDDASRRKFDAFHRRCLQDAAPAASFPSSNSVFDWYVDPVAGTFRPWRELLPETFHNSSAPQSSAIVPTADTVKGQYIVRAYGAARRSVLVGGHTGAGKTVLVGDLLRSAGPMFQCHSTTLSSQTSASALQAFFEEKLLGAGASGVMRQLVHIDDVNMPARESYGAQPPLELLRQIIDCGDSRGGGGLFEASSLAFRSVRNAVFVAAGAPPGGGRSTLPPRFGRHFSMFSLPDPSHDAKQTIVAASASAFLAGCPTGAGLALLAQPLVEATLAVFSAVEQHLLPTPSKSHYTFNLRDLTKVVQGLRLADPSGIASEGALTRLWTHEVARVFRDRLVDADDRQWLDETVSTVLATHFPRSAIGAAPDSILFAEFLGPYAEITDEDAASRALCAIAGKYAAEKSSPMDLVFFREAMCMIARIARVLRQPGGHALLVGPGGSGRRRLARLAAYSVGVNCVDIDAGEGDELEVLREDLRRLAKDAGVHNKPTALLLSDAQIPSEAFLSAVHDILVGGDISGLFAKEELAVMSELSSMEDAVSSPGELLALIQARCRDNLHCILAFSPAGDSLRTRLRTFPALVNNCTIIWFAPWPHDALAVVALRQLEQARQMEVSASQTRTASADDAGGRQALSEACAKMHASAERASALYLAEQRRYTYVTPNSFLELFRLHAPLLAAARHANAMKAERYREGLVKLAGCQRQAETLAGEVQQLEQRLQRVAAEARDRGALLASVNARSSSPANRERTDQGVAARWMLDADAPSVAQAKEAAAEARARVESQRRLVEEGRAGGWAGAEEEAGEARLEELGQELAAAERRVGRVQGALEGAQRAKEKAEAAAEAGGVRRGKAEALAGSVQSEGRRWEAELQRLAAERETLAGSTLLAAGLVAYAGPFPSTHRSALVEEWAVACREAGIAVQADFTLERAAGDPSTIRAWHMRGLPTDRVSTEHALIVEKSRRWPLMIDPQGQAKRWVRGRELAGHLKRLRLGQTSLMRVLENCIRAGTPVLLEDVEETLDGWLEPVLAKDVYREDGRSHIRLRDAVVDYDPAFHLYITSKLANPHYPPEVYAKVTVVNFSATAAELGDQLLNTVVAHEQPELEEARLQLVVEVARLERELEEVEGSVLYMIVNAQGNIVDDDVLAASLRASHNTAAQIQDQLARSADTRARIDDTCQVYRAVAKRGAVLYMVLVKLGGVDPMYQYSRPFFETVFKAGMARSPRADDASERVRGMVRAVTEDVFASVSGGLFARDKPLLALLIAAHVLRFEQRGVSEREWAFLLTRGGAVDRTAPHVAAALPSWIPPALAPATVRLEQLEGMAGLTASMRENEEAWRAWFQSAAPATSALPAPWEATLSPMRRMLLVRVLRGDQLVEAAGVVVRRTLGERFLAAPDLDLRAALHGSSAATPLLFLLAAGTDPGPVVYDLAREMGREEGLQTVSMGQGQGPAAEAAVSEGRVRGSWIFLQNCHLGSSWLPRLDGMVEELATSAPAEGFRLWLSSTPVQRFPVSLLQAAVKVCVEAPRGLRGNLQAAIKNIRQADYAYFDAGGRVATPDSIDGGGVGVEEKSRRWKRLLFSLAFFHALAMERRGFGPVGWNNWYEWTLADLGTAMEKMRSMMERQGAVAADAMVHVIAKIDYGGRVTDERDQRVLHALLRRTCMPDGSSAESAGPRLFAGGGFAAPEAQTVAGLSELAAALPLGASDAEQLGLHASAEVARGEREARYLVDTLVSVHSRGEEEREEEAQAGAGRLSSSEHEVAAAAEELRGRLPSPLAESKGTVLESPLGTFLAQEQRRFNRLLDAVGESLSQLLSALEGKVVMSREVEGAEEAMRFHRVPDAWARRGYLSLKPLGEWFTDLEARVRWMRAWAEEGPPPQFWISGCFFPPGLVTAALQSAARQHALPVDTLRLATEVLPRMPEEPATAPEEGVCVFGVYLEGARWNAVAGTLTEGDRGQPHTVMPVIWLKPTSELPAAEAAQAGYECPLYRVSSRKGVKTATGLSSNFVCDVQLPAGDDGPEHWVLRSAALLCQLDH